MGFRASYRHSGRYFSFINRPSFNYKRPPGYRKNYRHSSGPGNSRAAGSAECGLVDETFHNDTWISAGDCFGDYITFPGLGHGFGCRTGHCIRVESINLDGTFRVISGIGDGVAMQTDVGEPSPSSGGGPRCIIGVVSLFMVLDRQPNPIEKPTFEAVFGSVSGSNAYKADLHVSPSALKRFKVVVREKIVLNEIVPTKIVPFTRFVAFFKNNRLVTSFRDGVVTNGNYGNVERNGLMLYAVWESHVKSAISFSINSRMSFVNQ